MPAPAEPKTIGVWWELGRGARWRNEGVSRVIGFLIEGAATRGDYRFHVLTRPGASAEVVDDLRTLKAVEGRDWSVAEPDVQSFEPYRHEAGPLVRDGEELDAVALALWANAHDHVDGWVIPFPHFLSARHLTQSKGVLFPDAIPYDFPLGWADEWGEKSTWPTWRERASAMAADADEIITFSEHVGRRHCVPLLGVSPDKIRKVPLAPPDLSVELDFLKGRKRTPASRAAAAQILREHAAERSIDYLRNFPFEECEFIVDATQDRPTKNLGFVADVVEEMVRVDRRSMKLFLTARLFSGAEWTRLPTVVEGRQFHRDFVAMHDLPREVHAALFHAAAVAVHPSFYEGIIGNLPFYEAVSVGTPALFATGPHSDELFEAEPSLRRFAFDPYDRAGLKRLIADTIANRDEVVAEQEAVCRRIRRNTWADTAEGYAKAALAGHRRTGKASKKAGRSEAR